MTLFAKGEYLDDGKYQIIKPLGTGGFGITYLACECKTNKKVVIKFLDELRNATNETRLRGMVMEYIKGKDLTWHLQRNGIFSEQKALRIIKQIGSALDYIHNRGLLHRDIKPQNIMLCESTENVEV